MNNPPDHPQVPDPGATRPLPGAAPQPEASQPGTPQHPGTPHPGTPHGESPQQPPADETVVNEQPSPAGRAGTMPPQGQQPNPYAPPPQQAAGPGRFRRFAGHRGTQLVAAVVLGLVIGGGVVGAAVCFSGHDGRGDGHPGYSRHYDGHGYGDFGPNSRGPHGHGYGYGH